MAFTTLELREVGGLDTDGMSGFEAQIAMRSHNRPAIASAHLAGSRIAAFEAGAELARIWMGRRAVIGQSRRAVRQGERKTIGMMTVFKAQGADLKAEQLETLREAVATQRRVDAKAPAKSA